MVGVLSSEGLAVLIAWGGNESARVHHLARWRVGLFAIGRGAQQPGPTRRVGLLTNLSENDPAIQPQILALVVTSPLTAHRGEKDRRLAPASS